MVKRIQQTLMSKLAYWQLIRNWWSIEGLKDLPFFLVLFKVLEEFCCSKIRCWASSLLSHLQTDDVFPLILCAVLPNSFHLLMAPLELSFRVLQFLNFSLTFISNTCSISISIFFILATCSLLSSSICARGLLVSCPLFLLLSTPL